MLTEQTIKIGGRYNWRSQPERMIYTGMCEPRCGRWHQFERVGVPGFVWCEVLGADLHMLEETASPDGVAPSDQTKESKHGRLDEFRPAVRGGMVVGGDAGRPVAGSELSSVADKLWASEAVMSLNAELGLTLDQLVRLAKAIVSAGVSGDGNAQP